jgi:hypothetical protein
MLKKSMPELKAAEVNKHKKEMLELKKKVTETLVGDTGPEIISKLPANSEGMDKVFMADIKSYV